MLDDKGHPVIIDFDSCAEIGQDLDGRKTTFGWATKSEQQTSTIASDEYALSLIAQYLDGKVDNGGLPLPLALNVSILISSPFLSFISSLLQCI